MHIVGRHIFLESHVSVNREALIVILFWTIFPRICIEQTIFKDNHNVSLQSKGKVFCPVWCNKDNVSLKGKFKQVCL